MDGYQVTENHMQQEQILTGDTHFTYCARATILRGIPKISAHFTACESRDKPSATLNDTKILRVFPEEYYTYTNMLSFLRVQLSPSSHPRQEWHQANCS